jgi:hypothetical protein
VYNFGAAWDNNFHNFYLYRRATDGRWTILPWDADRMYGEFYGWSSSKSPYISEIGDPDTRSSPNNNAILAVVLGCHKARFDAVRWLMLLLLLLLLLRVRSNNNMQFCFACIVILRCFEKQWHIF